MKVHCRPMQVRKFLWKFRKYLYKYDWKHLCKFRKHLYKYDWKHWCKFKKHFPFLRFAVPSFISRFPYVPLSIYPILPQFWSSFSLIIYFFHPCIHSSLSSPIHPSFRPSVLPYFLPLFLPLSLSLSLSVYVLMSAASLRSLFNLSFCKFALLPLSISSSTILCPSLSPFLFSSSPHSFIPLYITSFFPSSVPFLILSLFCFHIPCINVTRHAKRAV